MNLAFKVLILFEVFVGFLLLTVFWALGVLWSWIFIAGMLQGSGEAFLGYVAIGAGGFGLFGIFKLVTKILWPEKYEINSNLVKIAIVAGIGSALFVSNMRGLELLQHPIILAPPIFVTLHLVYLGRHYLWSSS